MYSTLRQENYIAEKSLSHLGQAFVVIGMPCRIDCGRFVRLTGSV